MVQGPVAPGRPVQMLRLVLALAALTPLACGGEASESADAGEADGAGLDAGASGPVPVGAPCTGDVDCAPGRCDRGPDHPEGRCTVTCREDEDCPPGSACAMDPATSGAHCAPACADDGDCRAGYACRQMLDIATCWPIVEPPPPAAGSGVDVPGSLQCRGASAGRVSFSYDVSEDAVGHQVVPFTLDGSALVPRALTLPDRTQLDLATSPLRLGLNAVLFGFTNPIVLPPAPDERSLAQSGRHQLAFDATTDGACLYVVEERTPGTRLELDVYLAVTGLSAGNARIDPDLTDALEQVRFIFARQGFDVIPRRFVDVPPEQFEALSIVDDREELRTLVALSSGAGASRDELLRLPLFFVDGLDLPSQAVVGISQGLPGPAGLFGTAASGVVVSAELLRERVGDDPAGARLTGIIAAHEIGHFLGLFHTTETDQRATDLLADTPTCRGVARFPEDCPDLDNLMFPLASFAGQTLTSDQAFVLGAHPLSKEPPP